MRVDRVHRAALAGLRTSREPDRRLAFPRADLDDHPPACGLSREIVEQLAFEIRQPSVNGRHQDSDVFLLSPRRVRVRLPASEYVDYELGHYPKY